MASATMSDDWLSGPVKANITMGTNEYPQGVVSMSGTWVKEYYKNSVPDAALNDVTVSIYICDSNGNNSHWVGSFSISGGSAQYGPNRVSKSFSYSFGALTDLKGKAIYVKAVKTAGGGNVGYLWASGVTVSIATAVDSYAITKVVNPTGAGTITCASSATPGNTVTATQTPASGYKFDSWSISAGSINQSTGAFTMPNQAVTLTANYLKISTGTLNKTDLEGGGTAILTITPGKTTYTHKYRLYHPDIAAMDTTLTNVAAGTTSVTISIPEAWSAQIQSQTSQTGLKLILESYNGTNKVGEIEITGLTYLVPASEIPILGTITASIVRTISSTTYANVGEYYIQNHCGVRVQASASGAQTTETTPTVTSSIASIAVNIGGMTGTDFNNTVLTGSMDFTSGLLTMSGTVVITVTATDSRGRTASATETITVIPYSNPIGSLTVHRADGSGNPDDMGTYGTYELTKSYTQIGTNSLTAVLSVSGYTDTATNPANSGDLLPGNRKNFAQTNEYTVTLTLTDAFETTVITTRLQSARFIIYADPTGNKLGFFKAANKTPTSPYTRTFEISDDTEIYIGNVTLEAYIQSIISNT